MLAGLAVWVTVDAFLILGWVKKDFETRRSDLAATIASADQSDGFGFTCILWLVLFFGCNQATDRVKRNQQVVHRKVNLVTTHVVAEIPLTEEGAKEFVAWTLSDDGYAITKQHKGFEYINTLLSEDKKTIYLTEGWASKEDHQNYLNWRVENGMMDWLGPLLAGEFKLTYFSKESSEGQKAALVCLVTLSKLLLVW